jgi:hypothetical protein
MRTFALLFALAACGGTSSVTSTSGNPDSGTPAEATALQAGTYKATAAGTSRALTAVGPAMTTTLISDWGGGFYMVLPNYDLVRGAMRVNPDGTLSLACGGSGVGGGCAIVHQDGRVEPAVIVGTAVDSTIAATVNGQPFSVALTDIAKQDFKVSQMAATYISTSTSTGTWIVISITTPDAISPESGHIDGYAYASQADIGNTAKAVGHYLGSINHTDVPVSCKTCVATPNAFNIGLCYEEIVTGTRHPCTSGFAYFTAGGLVALTVNPTTGEQITAAFSR